VVRAQAGVLDRQAAPRLAHHHLDGQADQQGRAQNAFITTTPTITIDADGVPSVTEDGVSVDCRG
jgi:hypothetical protein